MRKKDALITHCFRLAISNNLLSLVKYFIECGINFNADNEWALRAAATSGYIDIVKYLVEQGIKSGINQQNNIAFVCASKNGHMEVVRFLEECYRLQI